MSQFCKNNGITQLHGAPRKPSTQGLVERNNQTVKQNIRNILKEKKQSPNHWRRVLGEAANENNIVEHEATKQTPYELVFGIPRWKEPKLPQVRNLISILLWRRRKKKKKNNNNNNNNKGDNDNSTGKSKKHRKEIQQQHDNKQTLYYFIPSQKL